MGVLKVKTAPGVWTPVTQGFDPYHQQLSAVSAGGTINAGASGTVVTLNTPAIPTGRFLLVTMTVHVRQTTGSAFDINMSWPSGVGIVAHQFGTGVNATGQIVSMTRVVPTNGLAQTFRIDVNAWGAQPVLYGAQSNIACTVMPLATAGLSDWMTFTPTLTQSAAVTKTVTSASYTQIGKTVTAEIVLAITGAGTAGQPIKVGLPVPARASNAVVGSGSMYDASASFRYVCEVGAATVSELYLGANGNSTDVLGVSPSLALAAGDGIRINVTYEAA